MQRVIFINGLYLIFTFLISTSGLSAQNDSLPDWVQQYFVERAASKGINIELGVFENMYDQFNALQVDQKETIFSLPRNELESRLSIYLDVKFENNEQRMLKASNFQDFRWEYLANDITLVGLRNETNYSVLVDKIYFGDNEIPLRTKWNKEDGEVFVIPCVKSDCRFSARSSFNSENQRLAKITYTNPAFNNDGVIGSLDLSNDSFFETDGCIIKITTEPTGATVYFNKRKYYKTTAINSVRDPNTWEVEVRKGGYDIWREEKTLGSGETWEINIKLTKKNN